MSTPEEQLNKLEALLKMVDGTLTKEEFVQSFENVVKLVMEMRAGNEQEFNLLHQNFQLLSEKLKNDTTSNVSELKAQVNAQVAKLMGDYESRMKALDKRVSQLKDGYTPVKGIDYFDGEQGDPGKPGKDGSPDEPEDIRDKLQSLKGKNRLDASAIKNLPKQQAIMAGGGNMSGGRNIEVSGSVVSLDITVSSTPPANPELNELWIEI